MEAIDSEKLLTVLNTEQRSLAVISFYTEGSSECEQVNDVVNELALSGDYKDAKFFKVEADKNEDACQKLDVSAVPCVVFKLMPKNETKKLVGADVPSLVKMLKSLYPELQNVTDDSEQDINSRLKKLINKAPCMLFMKGNPDTPRCGFSRQVIELLNNHSAKYETFDILMDQEVREGLKKFSNWPTYPQLYVKGELIGGLDILKELSSCGDLDDVLPKE